jgi:hypothetical protein
LLLRRFQLRVLAKAQVVLTQLVFEHSLRIRSKEENTPSAPSDVAFISEDPRNHTGAESEATLNNDGQSTSESRTAVSSNPTSDVPTKGAAKDGPKDGTETSRDSSVAGKINNLITTDMNNLEAGQSFVLIGKTAHTSLLYRPNAYH